jgi:hypothetical protein
MMQSFGALAIGYDPSAADIAAITAMFEKVRIVAENKQQFYALDLRTKQLIQETQTNQQMQYMVYITDLMVEYFKIFEPSECGCGLRE